MDLDLLTNRSVISEVATGGVLRNFTKLTGKHLCQSLWGAQSLRPATLLKKRLWHMCFPVNFAKFLRTPFLQNISGRLLLSFEYKLFEIFAIPRSVSTSLPYSVKWILSLPGVLSDKRGFTVFQMNLLSKTWFYI